MNPADLLCRILSILEEAGVDSMVTGSIASSHHGIPRATQDLDLVIELSQGQVDRFLAQISEEDYYVSEQAVLDAVLRRSMFNVVDFATGMKVDLVVRKDREFSREEFSRRAMAEVLGRRTFVASPEDVILSKLEWYTMSPSDQQLRDALGVLEVQGDRLDFEYVERWAERLQVGDLWRKLRAP